MLTLLLAFAVVVALAAGASGSPRATSPWTAGQEAAVPRASARHLAGAWKLLPAAPVTRLPDDLVSVWTGHEMIIHGIVSTASAGHGVTFAYRPATSTWVKLARGPKPMTLEGIDSAAWTGSQMRRVNFRMPLTTAAQSDGDLDGQGTHHGRRLDIPARPHAAGVPQRCRLQPGHQPLAAAARHEFPRGGFAAVWTGRRVPKNDSWATSAAATAVPTPGTIDTTRIVSGYS